MLASYVETASEVTKLSAPEFFGRYGEVGRVVNHLDGSPDLSALKIYELYQRHSKQVVGVVDQAIAAHASAIRNRELPDSSLLRLVCDSAVPLSVVSPTAAPAAPQEPPLALGTFVFRKKGQAWLVRFDGKPDFILLPSKGAAYLHLLLSNPEKPISAVDLAFRVARVPQEYILGDAGERSDTEARDAYQARYREIQEEMEQARKDNDEAAKERLRKETEMLAKELKDRGWAGRPKKEKDDRNRVRNAVGNAIRRAIEQIAEYDKGLAEHLQPPRLRCGNHPVYDPGSKIDWDL
jgi:hypothetical protein